MIKKVSKIKKTTKSLKTEKAAAKKTRVKKAAAKKAVSVVIKKDKYVEAIGRRKTAVARVRLYPDKVSKTPEFLINDRSFVIYFPLMRHQQIVKSVFEVISSEYSATVKIKGSGTNAQAEAIRLGVARAVLLIKPEWRAKLKPLGYMTRDPRMVERKHPGLRKARRAQQWRKR